VSDRLLSVEEAQALVLDGVEPLEAIERLAPENALGRSLAAPVSASTSLPPWDNSAMDGYAVRAADVRAASEEHPVRLAVVGESRAGTPSEGALTPGAAIRIATGAPMPDGADAVVPVELTTPLDVAGKAGPRGREASGPLPAACLVHEAVSSGNAVRLEGSDVEAGTIVAEPGFTVTPALVALTAGCGADAVAVRRNPVVAVLATGDEVRAPGSALGEAGIPDANGPGLRALVSEAGAVPLELGIAPDDQAEVERRLRRGIAEADLVVVSGGVSVGPYDVVRLAFEAVGRMELWRVAVQPGKPFAFGRAVRDQDAAAEAGAAGTGAAGGQLDVVAGAGAVAAAAGGPAVLMFGLPGNPVSSFVTFELFVRPVIRRLAGHARLHRATDRAVLLEPVTKSRGRRGFQRVTALRSADGSPERDDHGRVRVRLAGGQGSHVLSALAAADGLAVIPEPFAEVQAGTEVELRWLDRT
jgi:molybdopterin molybdotransferase